MSIERFGKIPALLAQIMGLYASKLTLAISHRVEEAPRRIGPRAAFHERHVMRRFDANHSEKLHENARHRYVLGHDEEVVRNFKLVRCVIEATVVRVHLLQAGTAEAGRLQAGAKLQRPIAFLAFEPR